MRVVYIAGAGRSGSTVVEAVLAARFGYTPLGEMRNIWSRSYGENQLCGCGVPFRECEFWSVVSKNAFGGPTGIDHRRMADMQQYLERTRRWPYLLRRAGSAQYERVRAEYLEVLGRLYGAVADASGSAVLVDSSKAATYAVLLSQVPGVDVSVVHVVRDSRAVAFSWLRRHPRPEVHWKSAYMDQMSPLRSARTWIVRNLETELLLRRASSYHRMRYEEFARDPDGVLSRFERCSVGGGRRQSDVSLMAHTVSGNPVRFMGAGVEIRIDEEWRSGMRGRDRMAVTAATFPLLMRYGYAMKATRRGPR